MSASGEDLRETGVGVSGRPEASVSVSPLASVSGTLVVSVRGRPSVATGWSSVRDAWGARSERGVGSMLMVGVLIVLLAVALVAMCIAGYLVAVHKVRSDADLAALSGAGAVAVGQNGCAAAQRVARANRVRVVACDRAGDAIDFVVTVRVEMAVDLSVPGLPTRVGAVSYAGSPP